MRQGTPPNRSEPKCEFNWTSSPMESRATASIVVWRYSIAPAVQPPCTSAAEIRRNQNVKDSRRGVRHLRTPLRFCNAILLAHNTVAILGPLFGHRSVHDRESRGLAHRGPNEGGSKNPVLLKFFGNFAPN